MTANEWVAFITDRPSGEGRWLGHESAIIADLRISEERAEKATKGWLAQAERDAKEIVRLEAELSDYRAYYDADMRYIASGAAGNCWKELKAVMERIEARRAIKTKEGGDER